MALTFFQSPDTSEVPSSQATEEEKVLIEELVVKALTQMWQKDPKSFEKLHPNQITNEHKMGIRCRL